MGSGGQGLPNTKGVGAGHRVAKWKCVNKPFSKNIEDENNSLHSTQRRVPIIKRWSWDGQVANGSGIIVELSRPPG